MRKTVGTENEFPPLRSALEASFNEVNHKASILSVGARALSKHFHRDQANSWWGNCTGMKNRELFTFDIHAANLILFMLRSLGSYGSWTICIFMKFLCFRF